MGFKKIAEEEHIRNWASEVRCILAECNLLPWWRNNSCGIRLNNSEFRNVVSCCLFRFDREKRKTEVITKPKLRKYANFKERYEPEEYIDRIQCKAQRSVVARLRGGTVPLEIKTCRYVGIPAEHRICKLCRGAVEDEVHFCITCPAQVLPQSHFYSQWTPGFMDHRNLSKSYMLQTKTTKW